jgi:hypothetical protein
MIHAYILATLADTHDTRFLIDMARFRQLLIQGTGGTAKIHLYSNVDKRSWQIADIDCQYIHDVVGAKEFDLPTINMMKNPQQYLPDILSLHGLTDSDSVILYVIDHGSEEGVYLSPNKTMRTEHLV